MTLLPFSSRFVRFAAALALGALAFGPAVAAAQSPAPPRQLTLEEAIKLAQAHSPALDVARASEAKADAESQRANSQRLPQVNFVAGYDRTLASEFSSAFESLGTPCPGLSVDASKPLGDRVAELERAASCGGFGGGLDFSSLPFGQRNAYRFTFAFSQALYTGGRVSSQLTQASLAREIALLGTNAAEAQVALNVTRAFYDAALADRLVAIAEAGEQQAEAALKQATMAVAAGRQPEFEMLRAQVTRDNQKPVVIRRRSDRDIAYLRLRQLLGLKVSDPFAIVVDLDDEKLPPPAVYAGALATAREAELTQRVGTRQAELAVKVREAGLTTAKSERRPTVNLQSSYGQVGYPASGAFPGSGDFRTNWTMGAQVSWPIFTGFRVKAGEHAALAELNEARGRLEQAREAAELEATTATEELSSAEAVWEASGSAITQAQRAYQIAELRYREGLSTQLELQDSRLALQLAQANRAMAARDMQVARAHLALLLMLPFGAR